MHSGWNSDSAQHGYDAGQLTGQLSSSCLEREIAHDHVAVTPLPRTLFERFVAVEHECCPPSSCDPRLYDCPECGQAHAMS